MISLPRPAARLLASLNATNQQQTRYLSQAIQLEEAVNPHIIRATMGIISSVIMVFLVWSSLTTVNEVAHTPGEVIPSGYQQTIQHFEGGVVKKIHVSEGERVQKGQALLTLHESGVYEDVARARSKQLALMMQEERLRAFADNRTPNFRQFKEATPAMMRDQESLLIAMQKAKEKEASVIASQISEKKQILAQLYSDIATAKKNYVIADDVFNRRSALGKKGYASQIKILEDKQQRNSLQGEIKRMNHQIMQTKQEIQQFSNRLASLNASQRNKILEQIDNVAAQKEQNAQLVEKLQERMRRLVITAPVSGILKGLSVNTIGAVIQPGQPVMDIVPVEDQMMVEVKIKPQDIGHVAVGQPVKVKISSYDFSRYGMVEGTLSQISAGTFDDENSAPYFQGKISLGSTFVGNNPSQTIMPGMTVMADIITGEKTILQYMLKPIHLSLQTAFSER